MVWRFLDIQRGFQLLVRRAEDEEDQTGSVSEETERGLRQLQQQELAELDRILDENDGQWPDHLPMDEWDDTGRK